MKLKLIAIYVLAIQFQAAAQMSAPQTLPPTDEVKVQSKYEIEVVTADSVFLIETTYKTVKDSPRPQAVTTAFPFKSLDAIGKTVADIRKQSEEARKKAEELSVMADLIDKELAKTRAVAKK